MAFKPLKYTEEECGKKVSNSKRRYLWIFDLDEERYHLQLICSFMSGKRHITLNSTTIYSAKSYNMKFLFDYYINSHSLRIVQNISCFALVIDNTDFIYLLKFNHEKSKQRRQQAMDQERKGIEGGSVRVQNNSLFQQFQSVGNEEKSVSQIKPSDFEKFFMEDQEEQKVEIQLNTQYDKGSEVGAEKEYNGNRNSPQKPVEPIQMSKDYSQEENRHYQQQQGFIKVTPNQGYIPTAKQIFKQKKAKLFKFLKL